MTKPIGAYLSPGNIYGFDFIYAGEVRFGPPYYYMVLQGKLILDKVFGFEFKWDADARYIAIQEWLLDEQPNGSLTALSIIDPMHQTICQVTPWEQGLVFPIDFKEDILSYEKEWGSNGHLTQHQVKLTEIGNWTRLREG